MVAGEVIARRLVPHGSLVRRFGTDSSRHPDGIDGPITWWGTAGGVLLVHESGVAAWASADGVLLDGEPDAIAARHLFQAASGAVLATRGRWLLHAAAVVDPSTERAIVVVGPSGAGKSSAAFRAWRSGWLLVADDLVVVDTDADDALQVWGVSRAPAVPAPLVTDPAPDWALDETGGRPRWLLPVESLHLGPWPLGGVHVLDRDGPWSAEHEALLLDACTAVPWPDAREAFERSIGERLVKLPLVSPIGGPGRG